MSKRCMLFELKAKAKMLWGRYAMSTGFLHSVASPRVYETATEQVNLWRQKARVGGDRSFEVSEDVFQGALDMIYAVAFGSSIGATRTQLKLLRSLEERDMTKATNTVVEFPTAANPEDFEAIRILTESAEIAMNSPVPRWHHWFALKTFPKLVAAGKSKDKMIKARLDAAWLKFSSNEKSEGEVKGACDLLVQKEAALAHKDGRAPAYDTPVIQDELFGFLVGGHETTSTSICWGLKFLTAHQRVQQKLRLALRAEFRRAFEAKEAPTVQEILASSIPYLDATIEEVLRCGNTALASMRRAMQDTEILGHRIPKGTDVFLVNNGPGFITKPLPVDEQKRSKTSQESVSRHGMWDVSDIGVFQPERWLTKNEKGDLVFDPLAGPMLGFGLGPRGCWGRKLALLEMNILFTLVIWNLELLTVPDKLSTFAAKDVMTHVPQHCYLRLAEATYSVRASFISNAKVGIPGDFNLTLLDHIYDVDGLEWVGNTNELNAAYATDGYARTTGGAGCFVTTHGVGELSALNGVAGSMTEQVKSIHVVGQTSRKMQKNRMMIHHSIGFNPDHNIFNNASKAFRVAAAEIQSEEGATEEIDRVLRECFVKSRPVYIFLPIDLVDKHVSAKALEKPLDLKPVADEKKVEEAANAVLDALYASKNPSIFVDCLVQRYQADAEMRELVDKLAIPIYTSNMGKGIIDEDHPQYVGLYNGMPSGPGVEAAYIKSDLMIVVGNLPSDTNSGGFTRQAPAEKIVAIDADNVTVKEKTYPEAPIKAVLRKLLDIVTTDKVPIVEMPKLPERPLEDDRDSKLITQSWVWHRLAEFLEPNDVIFGETGTAAFGIPDATFPPHTQWITQTYYGSIGYATPAAFGVEVALTRNEAQGKPRGRTILVTGDGSLMLTVQEVGNMVKQGLKPIIILINNAGYTIERVIHGARQSYNDIVPFNYSHMLPFFNMPEGEARMNFHRAETKAGLEEILGLEHVRKPKTVQIVEVVMDMMDVPWRLSTQIATRGPAAVKEMQEAGFKVRQLQKQEG
ncbi:hypothetical protein LTR56_000922 [Elasticomyces elasticus]|nr:hypothetical protein LTR56_000922 [Elasticomyces elasticus]KAK4929861.1 hypothetical protein LTR49_003488 [Elasticomyces elasticus]KAK5759438.1 hypothetical protein LTS12_010451 [Elasticomyces elasticus]